MDPDNRKTKKSFKVERGANSSKALQAVDNAQAAAANAGQSRGFSLDYDKCIIMQNPFSKQIC